MVGILCLMTLLNIALAHDAKEHITNMGGPAGINLNDNKDDQIYISADQHATIIINRHLAEQLCKRKSVMMNANNQARIIIQDDDSDDVWKTFRTCQYGYWVSKLFVHCSANLLSMNPNDTFFTLLKFCATVVPSMFIDEYASINRNLLIGALSFFSNQYICMKLQEQPFEVDSATFSDSVYRD